MSSFVEYIVKEGERWDTVAYKAYGDSSMVSVIIENNPNVAINPILQTGTRLLIPVLEKSEIEINSELLPPWKR
jgi:phage tail protein X